MKRTLLSKVMQLRYFAMLLIIVLSGFTANAALESDDINAAILVEGSIPVKWTNDATHPWILTEDGTTLSTDNVDAAYTSTISFTYNSTYPTELSFTYSYRYQSSSDSFIIKINDSEYKLTYTNSEVFTKVIPAGTTTVQFITSVNNRTDDSYYSRISNLRVWECKELETGCLKKGSMNLTFKNDTEYPWIAEADYIRSTSNVVSDATSTISTSFEIEKAGLFSFEYIQGNNYSNDITLNVIIDGISYKTFSNSTWQYEAVVLYPGNHTIEFQHSNRTSYTTSVTQIRNVYLSQTWDEVTVSQPGTFSNRLIQVLGDRNLQDAELVKITGSLNDDDWITIKQLTGIKAIDFTNTDIKTVPNEAFRGLSNLSTVMLPETLIEIGDYAFYGTNSHRFSIPASVESIGHQAWSSTPLQFITFSDNSKLKRIGYRCFYETNLIEFIMPDEVNDIGRYTSYGGNWNYNGPENANTVSCQSYLFESCSSLKKLHLSESLLTVPAYIAIGCTSLGEVNIPQRAQVIGKDAFYNTNLSTIDLPENLTEIGNYAFAKSSLTSITIPKNVSTYGSYIFNECKQLKTVVLNSHCWNMNREFSNCTALETVVVPCATPPSIRENPFYNVNLANVKLIVPDFAYQAYRTDIYWYQFTNIQAGNEASFNDYWAIRGELTLDSSHIIQGTPSLEIMTGGILNMDTDAQQVFDQFTYHTRESYPASYFSESNNIKANKLTMTFEVEKANTWYFFSPVCDVKMSDVTYPATDSWVIRYYDGARRAAEQDNTGNWINVPADGMLLRGHGYIIQANAAGILNLPVAETEHDKFFGANEVTMALEDNTSETAAHAGWNFVANPYPSYYDIYYIDMEAPITVWTGSTYRAFALNDGDRGDDNYVLRPMQPFFVQKASTDLTARMPLTGRRTSSVIDRTRAPRRTPSVNTTNRDFLNLQLIMGNKENVDDYTRIVINEEASINYEMRCDASKFMSLDNAVAQIYSISNDKHPMAINERPYDNGNVALGVYLPVKGITYRISATRTDRQAWIYDAETGIEHDLTSGDYNFTASKTGKDDSRFSIRFASGTSNVESAMEDSIKVIGNSGSISVNAPANALVTVYSTDGSVIATATVDATTLEIPVANGIYVVKVNGETFKTIVK